MSSKKMKVFFSILICVNLAYGQGLPENSFESFLKDFINKSIKADNILKGPFYVYTIRVDYFIDTTDFCIEIANDFWLAKSNYVEAAIYWEKSLLIFESLQDETSTANLLGNLGSAYSYMGDDVKAVDYLLRSLKIAEKSGDSLRMATCLLNIGGICNESRRASASLAAAIAASVVDFCASARACTC